LPEQTARAAPHHKNPLILPFGGEEPTLDLQGGFQGIKGDWEGSAERVTNRLEDVATTLLYGPPDQLVMAGQRSLHGRGIVLPHLGGAFYVGEQEGESACGRASGHFLDVLLASLERTL
jgi:hypothetical protein